ncbi:MAG TPA: glycoside hydrolase family 3 N-terminal domain-containing protein [Jatrophihabitans sp.]|nr:glycoside hydrolase family 3 N-terminal domain-containing protein [Jatrophihabitans sp.]
MRRTRPRFAVLAFAALALVSCTSSVTTGEGTDTTATPPSRSTPPSRAAPTSAASSASAAATSPTSRAATSSAPALAPAQRVFAAMSERERVGQLLMVDCPSSGVADATRTAITRYHVGAVILDGTSYAGRAAIRGVTSQLRSLAPRAAGLFIATDQEGGQVQRLQGPGFSRIPDAVTQGRESTPTLLAQARTWGGQLRRAGVNLNLAPVLDVVPPGSTSNPPIGDLSREYGHSPITVTVAGITVANGMTAAGIDVTAKHFPGLGRVAGNTDTTAGVRDFVTTRHDAYLAPFRAAVQADVPFVMVSTAIYTKIDPANPAAFSRTIVTGMLRGDLGFRGVIISDDVGVAAQVAQFSPGQRAVRFVAAGGDVVLTVDATQAGPMTAALLARANADPAFKRLVDAAALRVLQAKQARGLL